MVQDSDFVRWSSDLHHVLVFTIKKTCVLLSTPCRYILPCVKVNLVFACLSGPIRQSLVLQSKYTCLDIYNE